MRPSKSHRLTCAPSRNGTDWKSLQTRARMSTRSTASSRPENSLQFVISRWTTVATDTVTGGRAGETSLGLAALACGAEITTANGPNQDGDDPHAPDAKRPKPPACSMVFSSAFNVGRLSAAPGDRFTTYPRVDDHQHESDGGHAWSRRQFGRDRGHVPALGPRHCELLFAGGTLAPPSSDS